jgi:hypothetical protein
MKRWFTLVFVFVAIFGNSINAQDAINLGDVEVCDGHREMLAWPATSTITKLIVQPTDTFIEHTKTPDGWPEVTPPGWQDPLQYTLWPVYLVNGRWMTAGSIQFWKFRNGTGSPLHSLAADWLPPGCPRVQPTPGQPIGFFVTAGNQRISDDHVVMERSNVVLITYPAGENQVFTFAAVPPTPQQPPKFEPLPPMVVPPPVVTPPVVVVPPVPGGFFASQEWQRLVGMVEDTQAELGTFEQHTQQQHAELKAAIDNPGWFTTVFGNRYVQMALAGIGTYFTTHQMMK